MSPPMPPDPSLAGDEDDAVYSLDVFARVSGVTSETILRYHERGLLRSVTEKPSPCFGDDALRRLRQLESLREAGSMNFAGLCLVSRLLDEVEQLREALRSRS